MAFLSESLFDASIYRSFVLIRRAIFQCPIWEAGENGVLLAQVYTDFHEFIATKKDKKQKRDKKTAEKVLYKVLYKHINSGALGT